MVWPVVVVALGGAAAGTGGRAVVRRYVSCARAPDDSAPDDSAPDDSAPDGCAPDGSTPDSWAADIAVREGAAGDDRIAAQGATAGDVAGGRWRPWLGRLAVPVATGVLCAGLAASAGLVPVLAAMCWLAACSVPLALIDARIRRLPDPLTAAAYAGTLALLAVAAAAGAHWGQLGRAAAGGAVLAGCLLALALVGPGAVGLGDVKLAASAGTALAWYGWGLLVAGVFAGLLLAACYGLVLLVLGRATLRHQIPFGPFLLAGTFAAVISAAAAGSPFFAR
jgi:leader peptidase (prepilin peptidase)/N-methyltransferase